MKEEEQPKTKAKDESRDRLYFTITPRLVWALCNDPFEYTFWCVVKDIAGEDGECILAREDLAMLSMMSTGKASACRESLMGKGLLNGDLRKDPGFPQFVWHLSIPDFWESNLRWAKMYPKIRDRVEFKRTQIEAKRPSPPDGQKEASPGDGGLSPHDGGPSPDDVKNNVLEESREEPGEIGDPIISALLELGGGSLNTNTGNYVDDWRAEHAEEWVLKAIGIASEKGGQSIQYVDTILRGWKRNGYPKPGRANGSSVKHKTPAQILRGE